MCAENYHNRERFAEFIAKITQCIFCLTWYNGNSKMHVAIWHYCLILVMKFPGHGVSSLLTTTARRSRNNFADYCLIVVMKCSRDGVSRSLTTDGIQYVQQLGWAFCEVVVANAAMLQNKWCLKLRWKTDHSENTSTFVIIADCSIICNVPCVSNCINVHFHCQCQCS